MPTIISKKQISRLDPVHPGEVLLEEFIKPFNISQYRLALDIQVPPRRINEIIHGMRRISADTALRLERYFGASASFWMNLQSQYDLAIEQDLIGQELERDIRALQPTL